MVDDRNRTSHTYNEKVAEDIYSRLARSRDAFTRLSAALRPAALEA